MNNTTIVSLGSINFNEKDKSDFLYKLKCKDILVSNEVTFEYQCKHYRYLVINPNKTFTFRNNRFLEYSREVSFEDFIKEYQ